MCECDPPAPRRSSRRNALLAGAAGLGALVLGDLGGMNTAFAQTVSGDLDEAGNAIKRAERLSIRRLPVEPPPAGKLLFPVEAAKDCYVLDNFGACRGNNTRAHAGIDILGSRGAPVYAVADGQLTTRYTNTGDAGWGWALFDPATNVTYKYFHMAEDPNGKSLKQQVVLGDILGFVGNSGTYGVDNYHLHFEVRPNNVPIDPLPLLHYDRDKIPTAPPDKACAGKSML